MNFKIASLPGTDYALTNKVYLTSEQKYAIQKISATPVLECNGFAFHIAFLDTLKGNELGMNAIQRRQCKVSIGDLNCCNFWKTSQANLLCGMLQSATLLVKTTFPGSLKKTNNNNNSAKEELQEELLKEMIINRYEGQPFKPFQMFYMDFQGKTLEFTFTDVNIVSMVDDEEENKDKKEKKEKYGILDSRTEISIESDQFAILQKDDENEKGNKNRAAKNKKSLFVKDFDFKNIGIGGLGDEFSTIFRRAFTSRIFSPSTIKKLGIKHVRGMLLYGPPGTGKTMIARKIGQMLNAREPKVVNGPEILNKYVGASEENIRNLFKDAEAEYAERGDESDLHIIIFDEIDAICKQRGGSGGAAGAGGGTGVGDTIVNQLLSKMDGVNSLNNILVIGMTNRKDMLDEALLRPGRLEVHVEINLPDERGRLEIFKIHTATFFKNSFAEASEIDLDRLSKETPNYSGADIEGVCRDAASWALARQVDVNSLLDTPSEKKKEEEKKEDEKNEKNEKNIKITMEDFERARKELVPSYAVQDADLERLSFYGIVPLQGQWYHAFIKKFETYCAISKSPQKRTPVVSVCVEGPSGSGKTALVSHLARKAGFSFLKYVSPSHFVGLSDAQTCQKINKVFEDAYLTPLGCIILDDVERMIGYMPVGPYYSHAVLQTLLVNLKRYPPKDRKVFVVSITSNVKNLKALGFDQSFSGVLSTSYLEPEDQKTILKSFNLFKYKNFSDDLFDNDGFLEEYYLQNDSKNVTLKGIYSAIEMASSSSSSSSSFSNAAETIDEN